MKVIKGLFAFLLVAAIYPTLALAFPAPPASSEYSADGGVSWYRNKAQACNNYVSKVNETAQFQWTVISTDPTCSIKNQYNTSHGPYQIRGVPPVCPRNSTLSGSECVCNSGYRESGNKCVQEGVCRDGEMTDLEFKIGWAFYYNDPQTGKNPLNDGQSSVTPVPPQAKIPLDVCYNGCWHYYNGDERYWVDSSQIDSGVVPRFGSAEFRSSDMACTKPFESDLAGDKPDDPEEPDSDDGEPGGGDDDDDNPEGEQPGGGRGPQDDVDNNPGGDDEDAGDDPNNGPGGGNNQNPAEQQCGVAGKPACNSKIDETGTPSGPGDKMDTGKLGTEFDKLRNQLDRIGDKSTKDTSWGVVPSWFRTGGCSPMNLGSSGPINFTIDYCPAVPYAQGAATFMWLVVTFFAVTGMVSRTLGAGARS